MLQDDMTRIPTPGNSLVAYKHIGAHGITINLEGYEEILMTYLQNISNLALNIGKGPKEDIVE